MTHYYIIFPIFLIVRLITELSCFPMKMNLVHEGRFSHKYMQDHSISSYKDPPHYGSGIPFSNIVLHTLLLVHSPIYGSLYCA